MNVSLQLREWTVIGENSYGTYVLLVIAVQTSSFIMNETLQSNNGLHEYSTDQNSNQNSIRYFCRNKIVGLFRSLLINIVRASWRSPCSNVSPLRPWSGIFAVKMRLWTCIRAAGILSKTARRHVCICLRPRWRSRLCTRHQSVVLQHHSISKSNWVTFRFGQLHHIKHSYSLPQIFQIHIISL